MLKVSVCNLSKNILYVVKHSNQIMFLCLYNSLTHVISFKDWVSVLLDMWRSGPIYTESIEKCNCTYEILCKFYGPINELSLQLKVCYTHFYSDKYVILTHSLPAI
jgi:hypothetical protein